MKANELNGNTIIGVPKRWVRPATPDKTTLGYNELEDSEHYLDGWLDIVNPTYNTSTQKLGELYLDVLNNNYSYEVIDKTNEEIKIEILSNSQFELQNLIQQITEKQIIQTAQAMPDDEALENQVLYPMWGDFEDEHRFNPPIKVQDFEGTELKLFKAIQPNDKRENTRPIGFPAGWSKIEFSGGIEVWAQPIGGDGKYPYLDPNTGSQYLVTHNGKTWKNEFTTGLNVWEPSVYGWIEVI